MISKKIHYAAIKVTLDHVLKNYSEIEVTPGKCRYNYRCQQNAVHDAMVNGDSQVAMCLYTGDDHPIIHFINVDKSGKYIDNTFGQWSSRHKYYLVKHVSDGEFFSVNNIFTEFRKEMRNLIGWMRWFTPLEC